MPSGTLDMDVEAILESFPLVGRFLLGPPLDEAEAQILIREMMVSGARFDALGEEPNSREGNIGRGRETEALWWTCSLLLQHYRARVRPGDDPAVRRPPPNTIGDFPIVHRLVYGPGPTANERRRCIREMEIMRARMRELGVTDGAWHVDLARQREHEAFWWSCAAHLRRKS